ncbi:MAG: hypothetical protein HY364_00445 [Candidatus Aenigmarchaeota archaeon]|nr:hypothetical protein [Candidatus Aenigmarchaeota archaeon]
MKGSALPVETIVIVILSIIVLGAVLMFFFGSFTPATEELKARQTIVSVCGEYIARTQCEQSRHLDFTSVSLPPGADSEDITKASETQAQLSEKAQNLKAACQRTGIVECSGSGSLDFSCARICCAAFCPPSAEE